MNVKRVSPFESGHPKGAYNVPIVHLDPMGMSPNPEFLGVPSSRAAEPGRSWADLKGGK